MNRFTSGPLLIVLLALAQTPVLSARTQPPLRNNAWEPVPDVKARGILGERLLAWRQRRLWRVVRDPFLLRGFEAPPGEHPWQGEHAGKWLHAATLAYESTREPRLLEAIQDTVRRLTASQQPNGYIGTYAPERRFFAPFGPHQRTSWDVWTARYVLYGLLSYEKFHPDPAVVEACIRLGDLLIATFGPGGRDLTEVGTRHGMSSTVLLESVLMLYERTGLKRFLDFGRRIHEMIEANPDLRLVSRLNSGVDVSIPGDGKAYQLMANLLGYGELYRHTGTPDYLKACQKAWENIRAGHLFVTGGPWGYKSDAVKNVECFALPKFFDPTNPVETCSTTTWVQLSLQLLRLTGEARYGAEAERAIFNHLIGAQSPDGERWAYFTSPNAERRPYDNKIHCCGSSGPRALEEYARHLIGVSAGALSLNSYVPMTARLAAPGLPVTGIRVEGNYPRENHALVRLELPAASRFAVDFRLPAGAAGLHVLAGGRKQTLTGTRAGFFRVVRTWKPDETILVKFDFPLRAEIRTGRDGRRWAAFTYGPLALAKDGAGGEEPLPPARGSADGRVWVESAPGPSFRLKSTGAVLMPYFEAGSTGRRIRTYFPLLDRPQSQPGLASHKK